ncbi:MAG TPA: hypothetical protein VFY20_07450 [Gemmatimonadales bacterium]|nr:hypothetical protein [Gemmatimonadales bacterium]
MFIELTDHLRCVAEHDESFVVLLPDEVVDRSVRRGTIGCPVCGTVYHVRDGVLEAGDAPPPAVGEDVPSGDALAALAGLGGPGGYMVLVGAAGGRWEGVAAAVPGVHLVLVNPPAGVEEASGMSVLRGGRLPLQSRSMRAVVLGAPYGGEAAWVAEAARVVLPGLRVVGHGAAPATEALDLLADAEGWWVAQRARR